MQNNTFAVPHQPALGFFEDPADARNGPVAVSTSTSGYDGLEQVESHSVGGDFHVANHSDTKPRSNEDVEDEGGEHEVHNYESNISTLKLTTIPSSIEERLKADLSRIISTDNNSNASMDSGIFDRSNGHQLHPSFGHETLNQLGEADNAEANTERSNEGSNKKRRTGQASSLIVTSHDDRKGKKTRSKKESRKREFSEALEFSFTDSPNVLDIKGTVLRLPNKYSALEFSAALNEITDILKKQSDYTKEDMLQGMQQERIALIKDLNKIRKEKDKERLTDTKKKWNKIVSDIIKTHHKSFTTIHATRVANAKKYSALVQKEVQKRVRKTVRCMKDAPNRSRKLGREMQLYWKRYDKELAESRRKAEKEQEEQRKREEELAEARRQQRKLNFLLTQTELYGHFMAKKLGVQAGQEGQQPQIGNVEDGDDGLTQAKAVENAENLIREQQERMRAFDAETEQLRSEASGASEAPSEATKEVPLSSLNDTSLLNPSSLVNENMVKQPKIFLGSLKEYQMKGLNWLANLYDQGINGILADEMGLGKTVQTVSFMAHLAEEKNIWGPFLIIAPTSTLYNWYQEFEKFCPALKVVPYWGNSKDRQILRRNWNPKKLYTRNSPFHVVITSYRIVVDDEKYFNRIKWQYLILDEAHAIKSSASQRWKTLLNFKCRNRLLLTGTPIQNSMAELWALLHFIMPTLFDSHEEFNEWFSKDIESHAENKGTLNEQQIVRLHMIIKPFMLRRVKKDVECEMPPKYEKELYCGLSTKQRQLYKAIKDATYSQIFKAYSASDSRSLMNLVMQFRKVCNHPELFERQQTQSPFQFQVPIPETPPELPQFMNVAGVKPEISYHNINPIQLNIPKFLYRNLGIAGDSPIHRVFLMPELLQGDIDSNYDSWFMHNKHSIFNLGYIHDSLTSCMKDKSKKTVSCSSAFSFLRFVDTSAAEMAFLATASILEQFVVYALAVRNRLDRLHYYTTESEEEYPNVALHRSARFLISELYHPCSVTHLHSLALDLPSRRMWNELVVSNPTDRLQSYRSLIREVNTYKPAVYAPPIRLYASDSSLVSQQEQLLHESWTKNILLGFDCGRPTPFIPRIPYSLLPSSITKKHSIFNFEQPPSVRNESFGGLITPLTDVLGISTKIFLPSLSKLIAESGKLIALDKLLRQLKAEGHRVLIFCQMTKMIDILEEYMCARGYKFYRLDGSSHVNDRRDMVKTFQERTDIFGFLLSTRAGGLGINLTSADTVIFYDHDWNPTSDAQAMDRVHRIGQTRPVTIYRMVCSGTIEERILKRAQQKNTIQNTVYSGKFKEGKREEDEDVMSLLLDDEEMERNFLAKQQEQLNKKKFPFRKGGGAGGGAGSGGAAAKSDGDSSTTTATTPAKKAASKKSASKSTGTASKGGKSKAKASSSAAATDSAVTTALDSMDGPGSASDSGSTTATPVVSEAESATANNNKSKKKKAPTKKPAASKSKKAATATEESNDASDAAATEGGSKSKKRKKSAAGDGDGAEAAVKKSTTSAKKSKETHGDDSNHNNTITDELT